MENNGKSMFENLCDYIKNTPFEQVKKEWEGIVKEIPIDDQLQLMNLFSNPDPEEENYEDIVYFLNGRLDDLWGSSANDELSGRFDYYTNGYSHVIFYNEIALWSSEDGRGRKYDEENDTYEDLEEFVWREFEKYCKLHYKIIKKKINVDELKEYIFQDYQDKYNNTQPGQTYPVYPPDWIYESIANYFEDLD